MRTHKLRTDPVPFLDVWKDLQTFQIRPDDDFEVRDTLVLQETFHNTEDKHVIRPDFTGREVHATVIHIMRGPIYGLDAGWVCMSIQTFFKVCDIANLQ